MSGNNNALSKDDHTRRTRVAKCRDRKGTSKKDRKQRYLPPQYPVDKQKDNRPQLQEKSERQGRKREERRKVEKSARKGRMKIL